MGVKDCWILCLSIRPRPKILRHKRGRLRQLRYQAIVMSDYQHIIMRQCLEVEIPDKKHQQEIQARIKKLAEELLNDLLDAIFSNVVPADVIISIDQLYIPLEAVDQALLETHILQQLQHKFLVAIQEEVHIAMQDPFKRRITPLPEAKLQAIKHYLLHGYFAWWMPITHEKAIEDLYIAMCHENPRAIHDLWLELSQYPVVIERFLNQFTLSTIQLSLQLLHPTYAPYLLDLADDFRSLQSIVLKANHSTHPAKLPTTLQHIVFAQSFQAIATGFPIQEVTFLDVCLQEVAQAFGSSYSALLNNLTIELTSHPSHSFKTHIVHHMNRLYESQVIHPTRPETTPISLLIKKLDHLLTQSTPIVPQQLDSTIWQILTQHQASIVRDLITGHLRSTTQVNRIIRYLSPAVFSKLIEVVQPSMTSAWGLIKQIWSNTMPPTLQKDPLIERLTVKFLTTSPSQQGEAAYIAYMMRQLPIYIGGHLKDWGTFIQANEKDLRQAQGSKLVHAILATLPPAYRLVKGPTKDPLQTPIDQYLLVALQEVSIDPQKHHLTPSLIALLETAYQATTSLLAGTTHPKETSKKLQTALQDILQVLTRTPQQVSWATAQLDIWMQSVAEEMDHSGSARSLPKLRDVLGKIVNQDRLPQSTTTSAEREISSQPSLLITKSIVQDFFTYQILPIGYTSATAFMLELAQQVKNSPTDHKKVLSWVRQSPIQQQIWQDISPAARNMLLNVLLPLSQELREGYYAWFIKADVLRPPTPLAKELLLNEIFLEVANKHVSVTATHFLQLTLLALAEHTQLHKSEIYRRVSVVAQKHTPAALIVDQLQEIASFFTTHSTATYEAEVAVLPIYQAINSFLAPQRLTPEAYAQLEPWLQEAMVQEGTPVTIQTSLQQTLDKVFPTLSRQQKQQLTKIIIASLQAATVQRAQSLADHWTYFVQTSELPQGYGSPSALLGRWLDTLLAPPIPSVSPRRAPVRQQLINTLQTPYARKRLIASLPTQDLEKVVRLVAQDHSNTIINWIQHVYSLWDFAGSTTVTAQYSKIAWWDAALANIVRETPLAVQSWLTNSLVDFAGSLGIQPTDLLATLLSTTPPNLQTQAIHKVLQQIQQHIHHSISQAAQKDWPTQPTLQELYTAFTRGLSNLQDGTKLEKLAKQIEHLITHQASAFKEFLYTYPTPAALSRQIICHLSEELISRILKCLDEKAYSLIQQYTQLINVPDPSFYQAQGIDVFSWRKQYELATLIYFLDKQDSPFDEGQYLGSILKAFNAYSQQQFQPILRALIAYHLQHSPTPAMRQLIQQVEKVFSRQEASSVDNAGKVIGQPMLIHKRAPQVQTEETNSQRQHSKPAQDTRLYVKNSGLILVWPFIEELFNKQGLLEQGAFIDKMDHNNALHALQYVVTEEWSTPDWRLILNKLLCGMAYDEVTFAGYYLRDEQNFAKRVLEEQASDQAVEYSKGSKKKKKKLPKPQLPAEVALLKKNTEELLTTVLGEWTSLKELEKYEPYQQGFDIQAFRQYILQRDGMLQYVSAENRHCEPHSGAAVLTPQQDDLSFGSNFRKTSQFPVPPQGYWHLTITWEEYDSHIAKTPWSMKSVQLPFLRERIVVSWLP